MNKQWENNKDTFNVVDVRNVNTNFLPGLMKKAKSVNVGEGICVVQTFDPKPLYSVMVKLGFEYSTDKISNNEYRIYFYKTQEKSYGKDEMPFKPTAILNYKFIDDELAGIAVNFWEMTWDKEDGAINIKTKLLLSLSNAVGARRFRQATRELIKAYALGETVETFDELFSLFTWNQGIGFFSSEIGPSSLFKAYKLIKKGEQQGKPRGEVLSELMEKFGEKNPDVGTVSKI